MEANDMDVADDDIDTMDSIDIDDLASLLEGAIAETEGELDHLAMWAEALEDDALQDDATQDDATQLSAEVESVIAALAQDPAVQELQAATQVGPATQAMVQFLQATLALPDVEARSASPQEGGRKRSRLEGLTDADARELFPS